MCNTEKAIIIVVCTLYENMCWHPEVLLLAPAGGANSMHHNPSPAAELTPLILFMILVKLTLFVAATQI